MQCVHAVCCCNLQAVHDVVGAMIVPFLASGPGGLSMVHSSTIQSSRTCVQLSWLPSYRTIASWQCLKSAAHQCMATREKVLCIMLPMTPRSKCIPAHPIAHPAITRLFQTQSQGTKRSTPQHAIKANIVVVAQTVLHFAAVTVNRVPRHWSYRLCDSVFLAVSGPASIGWPMQK
jgi:hypothetical protein